MMRQIRNLIALAGLICLAGGCGDRAANVSMDAAMPASETPEMMSAEPGEGMGPGQAGDRFDHIEENDYQAVADEPLSTFSIDVDTASYSKVRMYLNDGGRMPPPDAVRIEELINYFDYAYAPPKDERPFAVHVEAADCPWKPEHQLLRIGIKGRELKEQRPPANLVFLLDVSGSMNRPNKLPLVKLGMRMLVDRLEKGDRVAIVVYAGAAGLVLPSTPATEADKILGALDRLHAGGSTNGGEGIRLAYQTALDNFIEGGVNRVLLCSDGDFNIGTTSTGDLVRMAEENAKSDIFLTVLGFGMGNHNDAMMEEISNKGNGNYAFIDNRTEARKVLVEQVGGTLVTIAKDVKIQVEFNPAYVSAYRLIGYENRMLAARDFNDDQKDAGEIGAGHTVTALYELVPAGSEADAEAGDVDELKYQQPREISEGAEQTELLTVKLRYKQPDEDQSVKQEVPVLPNVVPFEQASEDLRFAAAVAGFGMLLRDSKYSGEATYDQVRSMAENAQGQDVKGYRGEFLRLIEQAKQATERQRP